jgi:hypothetical protein
MGVGRSIRWRHLSPPEKSAVLRVRNRELIAVLQGRFLRRRSRLLESASAPKLRKGKGGVGGLALIEMLIGYGNNGLCIHDMDYGVCFSPPQLREFRLVCNHEIGDSGGVRVLFLHSPPTSPLFAVVIDGVDGTEALNLDGTASLRFLFSRILLPLTYCSLPSTP